MMGYALDVGTSHYGPQTPKYPVSRMRIVSLIDNYREITEQELGCGWM
jgi:hypothetical protein